ncbi:MAG: YkgJ family cysteine cluster protein, partial [Planctomycetota bacterium]
MSGKRPTALPRWIERRGGLTFRCTGCGRCCEGPDGYVWLELTDIERLAAHLGLDRFAFTRRYVRRIDRELALIDQPGGDCIFYRRGEGCTVYPARPRQCRTFPFWPEILRSEANWRRAARHCPGIDDPEASA